MGGRAARSAALPPRRRKPARPPVPRSSGEEIFAAQLRAAGINGWEREVAFIPGRRFRADFIWQREKIIVEVQGGVWWNAQGARGRHATPQGMTSDCEKFSLAATLGYRVLPVTSSHVRSGQALSWLQAALSPPGD